MRERHLVALPRLDDRADAAGAEFLLVFPRADGDAMTHDFAILARGEPVGRLWRDARVARAGDDELSALHTARPVRIVLMPRLRTKDSWLRPSVVEKHARFQHGAVRILLCARLEQPGGAQAVRCGCAPRSGHQLDGQRLARLEVSHLVELHRCLRPTHRHGRDGRDVIEQRDGIRLCPVVRCIESRTQRRELRSFLIFWILFEEVVDLPRDVADQRARNCSVRPRVPLPFLEERLRVFVFWLHIGDRVFRFFGGLFIHRTDHSDGHGDASSDDKSDCGERRRHAATVVVFAEYSDEPGFERRLAGQRKPAELGPTDGRDACDDFEQVSRVFGRPHAARQDQIVARAFTFHAKTPGGEPHQRIEPVQSTRDLSHQLSHHVATLDVGELVQ